MRTVGGDGRVMIGCRGARQFGLQLDVQLRLRQQAEILRQLRFDDAVDGAVAFQHLLVGLERLEARLRGYPLREGFQGTVVAQLRRKRRHLLLDARHFLFAQRVDLGRRQVEVRVVADAGLVPRGAVRQRAIAGRRAACGQVILLQVGVQACERGVDLLRGLAVAGRERFFIGVGEAGRQIPDRRVEDARLGIGRGQLAELRQHLRRDRLRLHDALFHAFLHVGDGLVDPCRELLQPRQVRTVLGGRRQRLRARAARIVGQVARDVVEVVQRQQVLGEAREVELGADLEGEDVVVQARLVGQARPVDLLQVVQQPVVLREVAGADLRVDRHADLVVVAAVAVRGRVQQRVEAGARIVEAGGQAVDLAFGG